jgi:hypothetical protein
MKPMDIFVRQEAATTLGEKIHGLVQPFLAELTISLEYQKFVASSRLGNINHPSATIKHPHCRVLRLPFDS